MLLTIHRNEPSVYLKSFDQLHGRIDRQAEQAQEEPDDKCRQAAGAVQAFPEHAQEEHDEDRRRQVGLHALQVVVQALAALDDRNPQPSRSAP